MARAAAGKPHFLLLPLPEQGHITPMLSLASRLLTLGCTVTFLKAEKAPLISTITTPNSPAADDEHAQYPPAPSAEGDHHHHHGGPVHEALDSQLRFRSLQRMPGGISSQPIDATSSLFDILKHTLAGLEERQGMVEKMVQDSKVAASNSDAVPPVTCIISDLLMCRWVVHVARRQAISASMLVPCAAFNFCVPYLAKIGKGEKCQELYQRIGLIESSKANGNATSEERRNRGSDKLSWYLRQCDGVEEASHVLVNSAKQLEPFIEEYEVEASKINFQFIGPCLPTWEDGDTPSTKGDIMLKEAGCLHKEEHASLTWLDQQEKGSVLLVSFGSEAVLEAEQVRELAMGIEASGYGYLWVVRANAPHTNMPPDDFRERTRHGGMCVTWVPQRKVLQHGAIGGFLTHCGWNSTLESVVYGVPMLCFPMNGDQFFNALVVHKHWKVGLRLGSNSAGRREVVLREEVEKALRALMTKRSDLHQRVAECQQVAQRALLESQNSLSSFVQNTVCYNATP